MQNEQIISEAISRIEQRRQSARLEQERRMLEIRDKIPETAEIQKQLRHVCMAVFQAASEDDRQARIAAIRKKTEEAETMLRQILTANGYPADYLDVHYTCSLCNDSGFTGGKRCTCLEREIGAVAAERLNSNSQLALCSFESFSLEYYRDLPHEQFATMENIFRKCRQYAEDFSPLTAPSLLMMGATGLGKTHLSLAIANVLLHRGHSVIYDSVGSLMHILEQEHFGRSQQNGDTLDTILHCDLLILDDFGTEFDTAFTRSAIYTILNGRMNAGLPVIISTNLSPEEIISVYGERIASRLFSASVMRFQGRDIRLRRKA